VVVFWVTLLVGWAGGVGLLLGQLLGYDAGWKGKPLSHSFSFQNFLFYYSGFYFII
jgi:hypothetical protein